MSAILGRTRCAGLAIAALLVAAVAPTMAGPVADVEALVTYETRQLTPAGVTRIERWQERLVRSGDTVWTERVLPARAPALQALDSPAGHAGHKHFDFDSAARWLQRAPNGELRLRYVDREHRVVVTVPQAEYGAVGFDGRWDAAAHLVPPTVIARMPASGAEWRDEHVGGWSHRVRWSPRWQLPLRVESRRDDGSVQRVVTLAPRAPTSPAPWVSIDAGYTTKEYDDFSD